MTARPSPASEPVPCDACGAPVDPLRAPAVAILDERFRYYCSRDCRERRRPLQPSRPAPSPSLPPRPSVVEITAMLGLPRAGLPDEAHDHPPSRPPGAPALAPSEPAPEAPPDPVTPALSVALSLVAMLVASASGPPGSARFALLSLLALSALGLAAREVWRARREPFTPWALGVAGGAILCAGGLRGGTSGARALAEGVVLASVGPVLAWIARARRAAGRRRLEALRAALPSRAMVVRGEGPEPAELSAVRAGEEVLVRGGEAVPVDGVVRSGRARVLLYAGAPDARSRGPGEAVLAGARVVEGELRVLATRAGDEVAWGRLARLVGDPATRPKVVRAAARLGALAPFAVVGAALAGAVLQALWLDGDALRAAACALALGPLAAAVAGAEAPFVRALAAAAHRGIVFRDAASVEAAALVGTVVLCHQGTATRGQQELVEVVSLGHRDEDELVAVAAAAEEVAPDDPVAQALTDAVAKRGLRLESLRRPAQAPGLGVTAVTASGEGVAVGSRRLLLAEGISVAPAEDVARALEGAGHAAVLVALGGRVEGVLGFAEPVRDEARSAVQGMMDAGFDVALLGGASRGTLEAVGAMLDVANLRPEVLPEERPAVVKALSEVGSGVAVVGRPGRDIAALSAADVAISLEAAGGTGAETAVALASDDLRDAASALGMARRARERAVLVIALGLGGAALGALAVAVMPSWGLFELLGVVVGVKGAEALLLRAGLERGAEQEADALGSSEEDEG